MTAKMSEARRRAFLSALRETGNQTLAAERAKVSRSWVQLQRTGDPKSGKRWLIVQRDGSESELLNQARADAGGR